MVPSNYVPLTNCRNFRDLRDHNIIYEQTDVDATETNSQTPKYTLQQKRNKFCNWRNAGTLKLNILENAENGSLQIIHS